jgi:hypothetical protein
MVQLHPNYGNPNGNPDGPTTLSGTGSSQFDGSSPGSSGCNQDKSCICASAFVGSSIEVTQRNQGS